MKRRTLPCTSYTYTEVKSGIIILNLPRSITKKYCWFHFFRSTFEKTLKHKTNFQCALLALIRSDFIERYDSWFLFFCATSFCKPNFSNNLFLFKNVKWAFLRHIFSAVLEIQKNCLWSSKTHDNYIIFQLFNSVLNILQILSYLIPTMSEKHSWARDWEQMPGDSLKVGIEFEEVEYRMLYLALS